MVHSADQNDLEVADADTCLVHAWLVVSEVSESTLLILTVFEHQENLQDHSLVFVASGHLEHEQKDAQFMKVETARKLYLRQVCD